MTRDDFWEMIQKSKKLNEEANGADTTDAYEQAVILGKLLRGLEPTEIESFYRIYDELRLEAYDNRLWAAAYIMKGGCSDDGFEYFRGWLITRGREIYERALADPESLVSELSKDSYYECEEMLSVAFEAYEEKVGSEIPDGPDVEWDLKGDEWDDEKLDELYPKLSKAVEAMWA